MTSFSLDPAKIALVIIDLQRGVLAMPAIPHSCAEVVEKSSLLAKHFRHKGAMVVYVRVDMANFLQLPVDKPSRDPNAPPPPASASELVPEAGFEPGDLLVTKRHWGAFAGTELETLLKQRGVDTVVITGISSSIGVESTVRQGTGLGFAFVIVEDACSARDTEGHKYSFAQIFPRLGRVRMAEEVIKALA